MARKAMFITTANIFDKMGNGGAKASIEHLSLVKEYFGKDNVKVCVYLKADETENDGEAQIFKRESSNFKLLIASLFACKVYLPWNEKEIVWCIDDYSPDLLFLDSSLLGRLIRLKRDYKTVVFYHNIEADYAWNKVKKEGVIYIPSYLASRRNDGWASKADKIICLNERDSNRLYECYGRKADLLIPITFEDDFDPALTTTEYKREILFLGSYFPPNQYSVEWFIKEVMPFLKDIKLNIVGRDFEKKKREYEQNKNVHVIGSVKELAPYYYRHCAVVQPIKYGAGMKVKTAEAMMYGRRIFASDEALEGYEIEDVDGITRCNSSKEFIEAINNYFQNEVKLNFYPEVRKRFLEKYNTKILEKKFADFLNEILNQNI